MFCDDEMLVVCVVSRPESMVYLNVFEPGDVWRKIQGCEKCTAEHQKQCCGGCPMWCEKGCFMHLQSDGKQKPFRCVVDPNPKNTFSWCALVFDCVEGSRKGTIRKVCEPIPWLL